MSDKEDGEISGSDSEELPAPATHKKDIFPDRLKLDSESDESDSSDEEDSPCKNKPGIERAAVQSDYDRVRRKVNIWSNVLLEQDLTKSLSRNRHDDRVLDSISRGPESYVRTSNIVLTKSGEEIREPVVNSQDLWNLTEDGESRNVKSRLGKRSHDYISYDIAEEEEEDGDDDLEMGNQLENKSVEVLPHPSVDDSEEMVARCICYHLSEEKGQLMKRIIKIFGKARCIELYNMTRNVEEAGGMITQSEGRRRSPGGVFILLLKKHKDMTKQMLDEMFAVEKARYNKLRREAKKRKLEVKYGSQPSARNRKKKQSAEKIDTNTNNNTENDENGSAVDDFELMDEPDIQIGMS